MNSDLSRLRWLCRRGVKELDVIFVRYFEQHYSSASMQEQRAFEALLALEDPVIFDQLFGAVSVDDPVQSALLEKLRTLVDHSV